LRLTHIPTQLGDVLILATSRSFQVHAIGMVIANGQQDFHARSHTVKYLRTEGIAGAVAEAKTIVSGGRRIFLRNLDSGGWTEVTH
jgi:hypothetical protein